MEFIVLNLDEATEEQFISTIESNNRTARLMRSEIAKLRRVAETAKKTKKPVIEEEPVEQKEVIQQVDEDFEHEIEYYLSLLKELTLENVEEEITSALPSRKHYQYTRILNRLKLESIRNLKEIKDLLQEEGVSLEDLPDFQAEYSLELKKIALISKALEPKQAEEEQAEAKQNNLIFVPTTGGDIRILDEIDAIPAEYYDRFNGLFQSIKDGTFKNVQRFSGNSDLAGLCEVKDFKVRVIFVRLNHDSYAVISAFIKKSDNDKAYRTSTIKKYYDYQNVESSLVSNLENEEFMQMQRDYEQELFRKLSTSEKAPVLQKKGGEA